MKVYYNKKLQNDQLMCTRATRKKKLVNKDIKTYAEIERPAVCLVIWWCFVIGRLWRRPTYQQLMPSHCLRRDICTICRCCSSKQNTQWGELIFEIMEHSFFYYIKIFLIILFLYHDYTKVDDRETKVLLKYSFRKYFTAL